MRRSPRGELAVAAVPVRDQAGSVLGAVVVSTVLPEPVAADAREVEASYTKFRKAEAFREPIKAVYFSLYLLQALFILFGAVWLALYLARRITTPLRLVAEGAERIAAGERGVRVEFPLERRRVPGADRVLQPHVGAPRAQRGGGRAHARRPHPQEPGAGGAAAAHRDRAGDGRHGRAGGGRVRPRDRGERRGLPRARPDGGRRGRDARSTRRSWARAARTWRRSCGACSRAAWRATSARWPCPRAGATGTWR